MISDENKKKINRYQIFTIICTLLATVYLFALYNAFRTENRSNIFMYGAIAICWILVGLYWYNSAKKLKNNQE